MKRLSVTGPKADALLLAGWLRSRLKRDVKLSHRAAAQLERVAVDGEPVPPPRGPALERERPALRGARRLRPRPDLRGGGQRSSLTSSTPFHETESS